MKEIEILVELHSTKKEALRKLSALGECKVNQTIDTYYHHPVHKILSPKGDSFPRECFRIRQKNKKSLIAYKKDYYDSKGKWIYSDEHETEVKESKTITRIIESLGFSPLVKIDNTKYTYNTKEYEIVFEEVKGLGLFLEVERKKPGKTNPIQIKKQIFEFIQTLGLKTSEELNSGKPELMLRKIKR